MGLTSFSNLARRAATLSARVVGGAFQDNTPIGTPYGGSFQSYLKWFTQSGFAVTPENAREAPTVYACVRLIAQSVARLEWRVMRQRAGDGAFVPVPRTDPLWRLLNVAPNPWMTAFSFKEQLITDGLLFGNGYAFIQRDASARPRALNKLRPDLMQKTRGPDNAPRFNYNAGVPGPRWFHDYEIFQLQGPGSDGLLGESPIHLCRELIALEIAATTYVASFLANNGRPSGALKLKGRLEDDTAVERLRKSWDARHKGPMNAGGTAILEDGAEWVKLSVDPDEAELIELRKFCRQQIAASFQTPVHMVGDTEKQSYASAEQGDLEFAKHCLAPWCERLAAEGNRKLLRSDEPAFTRFSFDELVRADLATRAEANMKALTAGWRTINEVRGAEDLPPVDGGDKLRAPLNLGLVDPNAKKPGDRLPASPAKKPQANAPAEDEKALEAGKGEAAA